MWLAFLTQNIYNHVMPKRSAKRQDINLLAKSIMEQATGQQPKEPVNDAKNPLAVASGKLGGLKGGKARAMKLSAEQRSEIAKKAANIRWHVNK
jgi:hypothetical protein